jgi:hypothetical protein
MMITGSDIVKFVKDILSIKTIPKPYEDLNDAFTIFYLEKTQSN